jgi:UDP-N-acetylmuramoyl-L-alanyl-D-glutamate--2,6-diaminopimelate ligase
MLQVCKTGVANVNMDHYEEIVEHATCKLYTYGLDTDADFRGDKLHFVNEHDFVGVEFHAHGDLGGKVRVGMPGRFNADNALAALSVCTLAVAQMPEHVDTFDEKPELKASVKRKLLHALEGIRVDGRMEIAHVSPICSVIIDYAHNAMSMESLLDTLRDYNPKRLVCVFGCGGNRAKDRRYSMGEIGGKRADLCVITADNPRFEKNEDIIKDIEIGLAKTEGKYIVIPDRREAIFSAIHNAEEGDMVAIIGKGHEDYQEIEGVRHHFKDREVVEEAVKEMK